MSKMVWQVRVLVAKSDYPGGIPGTHLAEEETDQCWSLADLCVYPWLGWGSSNIHMSIWKKKRKRRRKVLDFKPNL